MKPTIRNLVLTLTLHVLGQRQKKHPVASWAEAQQVFTRWIDANALGASDLGKYAGDVRLDDQKIGHISYNGRAWNATDREISPLPAAPLPGDLWVSRGSPAHEVPAATVVVDNVEDGLVTFALTGGGFVKQGPVHRFMAELRPVTEADRVRVAHRAIMSFDDGFATRCYSFGDRWNGWGKPLVTREDAERFVADMHTPPDYLVEWDGDVIRLQDVYGDGDVWTIGPETVRTVDGELTVYDLGLGGWCWHVDDEARAFGAMEADLDK